MNSVFMNWVVKVNVLQVCRVLVSVLPDDVPLYCKLWGQIIMPELCEVVLIL